MWLNLEALWFWSSGLQRIQNTPANTTYTFRKTAEDLLYIYEHHIHVLAGSLTTYIWKTYSRCGYIWSCNRVFRWSIGLIEAYQTCFSGEGKQLSPSPLCVCMCVREACEYAPVCMCVMIYGGSLQHSGDINYRYYRLISNPLEICDRGELAKSLHVQFKHSCSDSYLNIWELGQRYVTYCNLSDIKICLTSVWTTLIPRKGKRCIKPKKKGLTC